MKDGNGTLGLFIVFVLVPLALIGLWNVMMYLDSILG